MNYNLLVIISIVICVIISVLLSYGISILIFDEKTLLFKVSQLIIAIVSMMTFYAPIKSLLIKYMDFEEEEKTDD